MSQQQQQSPEISKAVRQQQQHRSIPQQQISTSAASSTANTATTSLPPIASDLQAHLTYIMEKSEMSKTFGRKQATGGILPIVRDPFTKQTFILLGLNHQNKYCHFHGWVDPGETQDQGAAREAFEESKGVLGALPDLWRAVVCKGIFSAHVGRGGMHLVNYGDLNAIERDAFVEKFLHATAWSKCSDEVAEVKWFDTLSFRHACLLQHHDPTAKKGGEIVVESDFRKGIKRKLRGWLGEIFADPDFWKQQLLVDAVDHGFINLIPISQLPKIEDEAVVARLPYCLKQPEPNQN